MARRLKLFLVDAFARRAFEGNPAAVVIVQGGALSDAVRQRIAAEMNQSETCFVELDRPDGGNGDDGADGKGGTSSGAAADFASASRFVLRWFTPTTEVPLCGHATLAASHVLRHELGNASATLVFRTVRGAGELAVTCGGGAGPPSSSGARGAPPPPMLRMSLPLAAPRDPLPAALRDEGAQRALVEALGLAWSGDEAARAAGKRRLVAAGVRFAAARGIDYALVEARALPAAGGDGSAAGEAAAGARALRELPAPDAPALVAACPTGVNGVIVVVRGHDAAGPGPSGGARPYRCVSRFFAPWMGIGEDAVTGSAHAVLAPHLDPGGDAGWWWARQASARGGDVRVRHDRAAGRVDVAGEATTVVRGEIEVPDDDDDDEEEQEEPSGA
jgi:predicted PhzF superfamily epimerase YddE/YHI9